MSTFTASEELTCANQSPAIDQQDKGWAKLLSVSLACQLSFYELMQNPFRKAKLKLRKLFLAAVVLPGRYLRYNSYQQWADEWLEERESDIIQKACDIFKKANDSEIYGIEDTQVNPPETDAESTNNRLALHKLLTSRANLVSTVRSLQELQSRYILNVRNGAYVSSDADEQAELIANTKRLEHVERVIEACRKKLAESQLITAGVEAIDGLLVKAKLGNTRELWRMPTAQEARPHLRSKHHFRDDALPFEDLIGWIQSSNHVTPQFYHAELGIPQPYDLVKIPWQALPIVPVDATLYPNDQELQECDRKASEVSITLSKLI